VQARISGGGLVVRQSPAPGSPLTPRTECRLWCAPQAVRAALAVPRERGARPVAVAVRGQP